jgi:hypothetical protein
MRRRLEKKLEGLQDEARSFLTERDRDEHRFDRREQPFRNVKEVSPPAI